MSRLLNILLPLLATLCVFVAAGLFYMAGHQAGANGSALQALQQSTEIERKHRVQLDALQARLRDQQHAAAQAARRSQALQQSHRTELDRYAQQLRERGADAVQCLDDDGLRLWRQANADAHPDSERDGLEPAALPGAAGAGERPGAEPAGQSHPGDGAVPGMRGQAPGPGADAVPAGIGTAGELR